LGSTVNQNQTLELPLGSFPSEGNIEITKQAERFEISEIAYEETGLVYNYKSNINFSGTEYIEITSSTSIGDSNFNQITIFRINITVTTE
jgi:hypothetical protein